MAGFAQYQKPPDFMCPEFGENHYFRYVFMCMYDDGTGWLIQMFGLIAGVYPCNCTAESDEGIAVECDNTNLGITRLYLTSYSDLYTYYSPLNV